MCWKGDVDHPADYEGTACVTEEEFGQLLQAAGTLKEVLIERAAPKGRWKLLPYQKLKNEYGTSFPDDLYHSLSKQDVYELPLDLNRRLITERWEAFAEQTLDEAAVMIFECCFIQNPVTVGMVKYDAPEGVEGTLEVLEARRNGAPDLGQSRIEQGANQQLPL